MKTLAVAFLLAATTFAQAPQPQPQAAPAKADQKPGSITGKIISPAGDPMPNVTMSLRDVGAMQNMAEGGNMNIGAILEAANSIKTVTMATGADGSFHFDNLKPGPYQLQAQRNGYVATREAPSQIQVEPGPKVFNAVITMYKQGIVSGRITDEMGDPYPQAQISLYRRAYTKGHWELTPANLAQAAMNAISPPSSGANGDYSIGNLEPGRYYIGADMSAAAAAQGLLGGLAGPAATVDNYNLTYYPSATSISTAVAIDVASGAEVRSIDIRMQRKKGVMVRGKLAAGGANLPASALLLLMPSTGAGIPTARNMSMAGKDGTFSFALVSPGSYTLQLSGALGSLFGGGGANDGPPLVGRQTITVGTENMTDITFPVAPAVILSGTIALRPTPSQPAKALGQARPRIMLADADGTGLSQGNGQTQADGTFQVKDLGPGPYNVNVVGPQHSYILSARYAGQDATRKPLNVGTGTSGSLDIVLALDGGDVSGTLRNEKGDPLPRMTVSLWEPGTPVSDGPARISMNGTSDESGAFKFVNLPPGDYRVAAWPKLEQGLSDAQEFRTQFDGEAAKVKLEPGGTPSVDVKLVSQMSIDAAIAKLPQ